MQDNSTAPGVTAAERKAQEALDSAHQAMQEAMKAGDLAGVEQAAARAATAREALAAARPRTVGDKLEEYLEARREGFEPKEPDKETNGQTRFAHRLAARYADHLMHVSGIGWHWWDGTRWVEDKDDKHAWRALNTVLRRAHRESMIGDQLDKDVRAAQSAIAKRGILVNAAALDEFTAEVDELDQWPHLLNTPSGALDLSTMELLPHDPSDKLTRITRGSWLQDQEPTGVWTRFLESSLPDPEVRAFLARFVGQALFGTTKEQKLLILTGEGSNGKSVFVEALKFTLGDSKKGGYAYTAPADLLVKKRHDNVFSGAVDLRAARWATASETEKGRELDVTLVKQLTGGDTITARRLHQNHVSFEPTHSLCLVANDPPTVPDTGHAIWRRVLVVPWEVIFTDDPETAADGHPAADPALLDKLKAATDEVLTWALAGWEDYRDRGGLDAPAAVRVATDAYRAKSDQVARFLTTATTRAPGQTGLGTKELHELYKQWAYLNDVTPILGRDQFRDELTRPDHKLAQTPRRKWIDLMERPGWKDE